MENTADMRLPGSKGHKGIGLADIQPMQGKAGILLQQEQAAFFQVRVGAGCQVINPDHPVAAFEQCPCNMKTNKPGCTGYQKGQSPAS